MKLVIASFVVFVAGCGEGPPNEPPDNCIPAAQVQCSCPDGTQSVKQCKSNGTWGTCQCAGL